MGVLDKLKSIFAKKPVAPEESPDSTQRGAVDDSYGLYGLLSGNSTIEDFLSAVTDDGKRSSLYSTYKEIEEGTPEICAGLDMYADYATQGGTVSGTKTLRVSSTNGIFDKELAEADRFIKISKSAWSIVRCMCQFGDEFREIVANPSGIGRLKALPRSTMYRRENEKGVLLGFEQKQTGKDSIFFEPWSMVHFRLQVDETDKYGRSILWSIRREARELMLIRSGLTIGRLSRAHRRLVHNVDIGTAQSKKDIDKILNEAKERNKRQKMIDPKTGQLMIRANPLRAEEDIYVPVRKDSASKVHILSGDTSIATLADVEFKREGIISALKFSKAWLGLTGPNVRAVVGEQGLNFMRTVRRIRRDFADSVIPVYQMALLLRGIPWEKIYSADLDIMFPMMSHADDRLQMEVDKLRLEVSGMLISQRLMSRLDILQIIFNRSMLDATKLIKAADGEYGSALPSASPSPAPKESAIPHAEWEPLRDEVLSIAEKNETVREAIDNIYMLISEVQGDLRQLGDAA